ncbi:MAG: hypothetical protein FJY81_01730 [Candidatus Aminicenantes bacterium]|nr:hypothetical protein [Candidatus Aminicenantes bacterium]
MQKIEKWRVEELSLLLGWLVSLLKEGLNPEWAAVFSHFDDESREILAVDPVNRAKLEKLVHSIKACFAPPCSFLYLSLARGNPAEQNGLDAEFLGVKVRLCRALKDIEDRLRDYVN